jgi:hypothetical protein
MLDSYLAQVQSLLDDPDAVEYTTADLTIFINDARLQIAGSSESLRYPATLALVASQQSYPFSGAAIANASTIGLGGILDVRMAAIVSGGPIEMRTWEYFFQFYLSVTPAPTGIPTVAAVLLPGIAGNIWFSPIPKAVGSVLLDAVCYPVPLTTDSTPEALSQPWQDAVPYFAAYLAYLNAQRRTDADAMFARYGTFEARATQMTTPTRLPRNYPGNVGARLAGQNMPITAAPQGGRGGG